MVIINDVSGKKDYILNVTIFVTSIYLALFQSGLNHLSEDHEKEDVNHLLEVCCIKCEYPRTRISITRLQFVPFYF